MDLGGRTQTGTRHTGTRGGKKLMGRNSKMLEKYFGDITRERKSQVTGHKEGKGGEKNVFSGARGKIEGPVG